MTALVARVSAARPDAVVRYSDLEPTLASVAEKHAAAYGLVVVPTADGDAVVELLPTPRRRDEPPSGAASREARAAAMLPRQARRARSQPRPCARGLR